MTTIRVRINAVDDESCARFLAAHRVEIEETVRSAVTARSQEMADEAVDEILHGTGEGEPKGFLSGSVIEPE